MHLRILIVEDSAVSALIMEAQINRREPDFTVRIRRTLKGGLETWAEFSPHIVILDLNLPDSAAGETISRIPDFRPSCVLAMSAEPGLKEAALNYGAVDFFEKMIGENSEPFVNRITSLIPQCQNCFPS